MQLRDAARAPHIQVLQESALPMCAPAGWCAHTASMHSSSGCAACNHQGRLVYSSSARKAPISARCIWLTASASYDCAKCAAHGHRVQQSS